MPYLARAERRARPDTSTRLLKSKPWALGRFTQRLSLSASLALVWGCGGDEFKASTDGPSGGNAGAAGSSFGGSGGTSSTSGGSINHPAGGSAGNSSGGTAGSGGSGGSGNCVETANGPAIYVSPTGTTTGSGSADNPYGNILEAVNAAQAGNISVLRLAQGSFNEALELDSSLTQFGESLELSGGWSPESGGWVRPCEGGPRTIIQGDAYGVKVSNPGLKTLKISRMEIKTWASAETPASANLPGVSLIALAIGSAAVALEVHLEESHLIAGNAGKASSPPEAGHAVAVLTCDGYTDCSSSAVSIGEKGDDGNLHAQIGTFDNLKFNPRAGTSAESGQPGAHGNPGSSGSGCSCIEASSCGIAPACLLSDPSTPITVPDPGSCGCGGSGGPAGSPGQGGGASIALYAQGNVSLRLENNRFQAGDGGDGAKGALGGEGADGGHGMGDIKQCDTECDLQSGGVIETCSTKTPCTLESIAGSSGAKGGAGGTGGPGRGGPSYSVVTRALAKVAKDTGNTKVYGKAGKHGDGSAGQDHGEYSNQ